MNPLHFIQDWHLPAAFIALVAILANPVLAWPYAGALDQEEPVMHAPNHINASEPFSVALNWSRSAWHESCERYSDKAGGYACDWPYLRIYLGGDQDLDFFNRDPDYLKKLTHYCYLEPCVTTNVTQLYLTIPQDAVPNSGTDGKGGEEGPLWALSLRWDVYYLQPNGTAVNRRFGLHDDSTWFNLTGADDEPWPENQTGYAWYMLMEKYAWNIPCDAMKCARKCFGDYMDTPSGKKSHDVVEKCVEACPGYGREEKGCITENMRLEDAETAATGSATEPIPSSTGAANEPTESSNLGGRVTPSRVTEFGWWVGLAVLAVM
ncbi:hypothetical protein CDV31_001644 [Fusarium ambrosium]|uniref:Uncharacterized protein n=1 Tax=Fusarium ambrosium TaxID=131363 RepID=A0A428UYV8_9HYPO|nr:hypothetical protein CDV31_001644 [Fusarium ambrosium]